MCISESYRPWPSPLTTARPRDNGFGKPEWFGNMQAEYTAGQHAVGLVDVTSLGVLEIDVSVSLSDLNSWGNRSTGG